MTAPQAVVARPAAPLASGEHVLLIRGPFHA